MVEWNCPPRNCRRKWMNAPNIVTNTDQRLQKAISFRLICKVCQDNFKRFSLQNLNEKRPDYPKRKSYPGPHEFHFDLLSHPNNSLDYLGTLYFHVCLKKTSNGPEIIKGRQCQSYFGCLFWVTWQFWLLASHRNFDHCW